jgi:hypothetical protein
MLRTVHASTYIKVPPRLAFAILTGYETYRDWLPDVLQSRRLAVEGDVAIAEFVGPIYGSGKLVLEFVESADEWLMFTQTDRHRRDGLSGRWDLEEVDGGSGVVVRASWSVRNSLFMIGSRSHMRHVLERSLDALTSRSLRLAAAGADGEGSEDRAIFSLQRTADSIEVELDGETYNLNLEEGSGA